MALPITVVVQTSDDLAVADLMTSLDAQTLAYADFRVVFLVDRRATALLERLAAVARRRPNVEVVGTSGGDPGHALTDTAAAISEGWVLPIGPDLGPTPRLLPDALEQLAAYGAEHDLGVVIGRHRPASDTEPVLRSLWIDQPTADPVPGVDEAPVRLIRAGGTDRTGILGRRCTVAGVQRSAVGSPTPVGGPVSASAEWQDGRLLLTVDPVDGEEFELSVAHDDGDELRLTTRVDQGRTVAELDLGTAADGGPLRPGVWRVFVHGYAADATPTRRVPFPAARLGPAAISQTLIAPVRGRGGLALDVGATRTPVIRRLVARKTTVVESPRGHLFTSRLSRLHSVEPAEFVGALLLGRFELPARLIVAPGDTRVECWVSGPPGRSALALRFGATTTATPVGLTLRIANGGPMKVVTTAPPATPTTTAAKARPKVAPRPAPAPPTLPTRVRRTLGRLRRRLPVLSR